MRITIGADSTTAGELWNLTCAFQRTAGIPQPRHLDGKPTVTIGGSAFGWESPAMTPERFAAFVRELANLEADDARSREL